MSKYNYNGFPHLCVMQVLNDVGQGHMALHTRGVLRQNICPANILITDDISGKVASFGKCRFVRSGCATSIQGMSLHDAPYSPT